MSTRKDQLLKESPYQYRWWVLGGLGLGLMIINIDVTVINLAIPTIGENFSAKIYQLQWINNIYLIAMGGLIITTGKFGDRFGHKTTLLLGVTIFLVGSIIASLAPNLSTIIAGRFIQGAGMAASFGMIFVLAESHFPKSERGLAVGLLVIFTATAQSIGPILGGFIVTHLGWRWAFLINVPVCLLCLTILQIFARKDAGNRNISIHYPSGFLILIAYLLILLSLNVEPHKGLYSYQFILPLIISIVLLASVFLWQRVLPQPLINLDLLHKKLFQGLLITRACFQMIFGSFLFILPLYLQNILGYEASKVGIFILTMTIFLCISSIVTGIFNNKFNPIPPIVIAQFTCLIGALSLTLMPDKLSWYYLIVGMIFIGVTAGIMYSSTNLAAVQSAPKMEKGAAYGLFISSTYLWYASGIAITGMILSTISARTFLILSSDIISTVQKPNTLEILPFITGAQPLEKITKLFPDPSRHPQLLEWGQAAFHAGFHALMIGFLCLSIIGILASLLFKNTTQLLHKEEPFE
ncbi:MFS transporter [Microbulbifer epialgicus]|uniref:MFS transporter n=1 Tax=Microbulbifer epialgicus TaxID=393907 RepID=A0ABV4P324_9GAMM